jgi:extracellular factor (EF) 3-hydroxypalmitic acid methyl ester biosynthesis protein
MHVDKAFRFLTEDDCKFLFDGARRKSLRRDEILFREKDAQPNLYVIRKGHARVERKYQGQGLAVARYGPEDVVGEISFLQQQPAHGSVVAEEDVEVDVLDGLHLQAMLASDTGFATRFYHSLALCLGERLLQIVPGIKLQEVFKGTSARPYRPRTGQLSERQFPQELTAAVEAFRTALRTLNAELLANLEVAAAQIRVSKACDDMVAVLNRFTQDDILVQIGIDDPLAFRDVADLARGVGGYVFRETFSFFMQSATIAHGFERPRGDARDRALLDRIERNEPEGDGRLGPLIDQWFLARPLCRSHRNSLRQVTAFLQEAIGRQAGPMRLTSLAAGTAKEVFDLLAAVSYPLYVTCIDANADDLLIDAALAKQHGCAGRITFLHADLRAILAEHASVALGPQHAIYGLGICDYLNDEQVQVLLDWVYDMLAAGGSLMLTNPDAASLDRAFTEHILDWPVIHRTTNEFRTLFDQSKFRGLPLDMNRDDAGVNLFARCRKH